MIDDVACPQCGGPMVSRKNTKTGQRFWGCQEYPACRGTLNTDGEPTREDSRSPSERARQNDWHRWRRND